MKADIPNLDKTPVPGQKAFNIPPGRAFLFSKWESAPEADRLAHVAARTKERGGIAVSTALVGLIEGEIRVARQMAQDSAPPSPYCHRVRANIHLKRDIFKVQLQGGFHYFVWSRRCDGIISYGNRLPSEFYTWTQIQKSRQEEKPAQ